MPKSMKTNGADGQTRTDDLLITNQRFHESIDRWPESTPLIANDLPGHSPSDPSMDSIAIVIGRNSLKSDNSHKSTLIVYPRYSVSYRTHSALNLPNLRDMDYSHCQPRYRRKSYARLKNGGGPSWASARRYRSHEHSSGEAPHVGILGRPDFSCGPDPAMSSAALSSNDLLEVSAAAICRS